MAEKLIGEYGALHPLAWDEIVELNRDVEEFEAMTDWELAPRLLNPGVIDDLRHFIAGRFESGESSDRAALWAMIHQQETVVGLWTLLFAPGAGCSAILQWTVAPDWSGGEFEKESLRILVDWAFDRRDCRTLSVSVCPGEDAGRSELLRRMGFRPVAAEEQAETYRLTKTVEGRLL